MFRYILVAKEKLTGFLTGLTGRLKNLGIFQLFRYILVAKKEKLTGFLTGRLKNLDQTGRSIRPVSISDSYAAIKNEHNQF